MSKQRRGKEREKQAGPSLRLLAGLDCRPVSRGYLSHRRKGAGGERQRWCGQSQLPHPVEAAC